MLVGYYNTGDHPTIIWLAVVYCWTSVVGDGRAGKDWGTFWLGVGLAMLSLCLFLANAVGGVIVPGELRLGGVARVNPERIFFPFIGTDAMEKESENYEAWQRFKTPKAFRAVSDLVQMKVALKDKYNITSIPINPNGPQPGLTFDYSYVITGYDFGFQRAPGLVYRASGTCNTRYDWYDLVSSTAQEEVYRHTSITDNGSPRRFVVKNETTVPTAEFYVYKSLESRRPFVLFPHTANRESPTPNPSDPWYLARDVEFPLNTRIRYRVANARPVVYCEQSDTYEFEGQKVDKVLELHRIFNKTDSKISSFWWDHIFQSELGSPAMAMLGNSLGSNSLQSSQQYISSDVSIDLKRANLTADLERLVLGALVYSREIVRSTALTTKEQRGTYKNMANVNSTDGRVPDGYADFILSVPDVTTMSVKVLIVTPAVCLFIWILILFKAIIEHYIEKYNDSWRDYREQRTTLRSAVQLYRRLDEEVSGKCRWEDLHSTYPYVSDVSGKYMGRISEFEVVPTSARNSGFSPSPSPPPQTYDGISMWGMQSEIYPVPAYDVSPGVEEDGDLMRPLVAASVRPAFVPLHARSSSAPAYASQQ